MNTRRFAVGHLIKDDQPTVLRQWYIGRQTGAAGGIVSSASDLLRYARFQLGDGIAPDGTRLLAAATLARMQTPLAEWSNESSVGIAWNLREIGGERIVSHGGATNGQLAQIRLAFYAPDRVIGLDPPFKDARAEFLRDEHGQLRWFRIGQRATARVE